MSQVDNLEDLFRMYGNKLTLGQILDNHKLIGSKYTNRISELEERLKARGLTITCEQFRDHPTENIYRIETLLELFK